ncbi:uncharacterized protein [Musca autumnalis]|uniref:uncharacterized protein n=1 Tax=Musca autumnalis TaxID=221902 RepID=UPI003CE8AECF
MKFLTIAVFVALCVVSMAHEHHEHHGHDEHHEHYSHPKYEFKYGVKDLKTEDIKEQWEHRDGDKVHGGYLLKEADGTTRVVNYHADDHSGFHADVITIGHAKHPETHNEKHDHHDYHVEQVHHHVEHADNHHADYAASSHHAEKDHVVEYANHVQHADHHSGHHYSNDHHGHAASFVNVHHH